MWDALYIYLLLFGWWLPAALFYALGIVFLFKARRKPRLIRAWCFVFLLSFAYTLYDGIYLKREFDRRAEFFKNSVTYMKPPSDVRVIQWAVSKIQSRSGINQCDVTCVMLLFGGRFDNIIIYDPGVADFIPTYRNFSLINQAGCTNGNDVGPNLLVWAHAGRCVGETKSEAVDRRRRFVVIGDQVDDPMSPPWAIQVSYVQLVDGDRVTPIARTEKATRAEFAYPFPIPGSFPRHTGPGGFPTDFRAGFLFYQYDYGEWQPLWRFVEQVFGISLNGPIPKPPGDG